MAVTDFEYAIIKSQVSRLLAGENLGEEVVRQLEIYIAKDERCRQLVEDKKAELASVINLGHINTPVVATQVVTPQPQVGYMVDAPTFGDAPEVSIAAFTHEAVSVAPTALKTTPDPKAALRELFTKKQNVLVTEQKARSSATNEAPQIKEQAKINPLQSFLKSLALVRPVTPAEAPAVTKPGFKKPLVLGAGLAIVITAMSIFAPDPSALMGSRANGKNLLAKSSGAKTSLPKPLKKNRNADQWRKIRSGKVKSAMKKALTETTQAQPFAPVTTPKNKLAVKGKVRSAMNKVSTGSTQAQPFAPTPAPVKTFVAKTVKRKEQPKLLRARKTLKAQLVDRKNPAPVKKTTRKKALSRSKADNGTVRVYSPSGDSIK
jgi:hypothetical protein